MLTSLSLCLPPPLSLSLSQLAMDVWVMILRFMGDLPEPVVEEDIPIEAPPPTGLRKKVSTLGRKFLSSHNKLIAQTGGLEGEDEYQPEENDEQSMVITDSICFHLQSQHTLDSFGQQLCCQ